MQNHEIEQFYRITFQWLFAINIFQHNFLRFCPLGQNTFNSFHFFYKKTSTHMELASWVICLQPNEVKHVPGYQKMMCVSFFALKFSTKLLSHMIYVSDPPFFFLVILLIYIFWYIHDKPIKFTSCQTLMILIRSNLIYITIILKDVSRHLHLRKAKHWLKVAKFCIRYFRLNFICGNQYVICNSFSIGVMKLVLLN